MHALIHQLSRRFALDEGRVQRLWALSGLYRRPDALALHLHRGLAVLAALLLGAGLIFWVAANWTGQTRAFKLHLLEAAVLASSLAAWLWPRGRTALLLLATLALGGLLAFVGQTYQTGADAWQLFATWAALALVWALAARRDGLWAVWLLITGLALALWSDDALLNPLQTLLSESAHRSLLTPLLWGGVFLLPLALPRLRCLPEGAASAPLSWRLAALMALGAWCAYALLGLVMRDQLGQYFFNGGLVVGAAALAWARRPRDFVVLGLAVLALNVLVVSGFARLLLDNGDGVAMALVLTLIAAACVGVSATWLLRLQREEGVAASADPAVHSAEGRSVSTGVETERRLIARAEGQGLLPPEARADVAGPSWILTALSFVGAQLVVLPFMGFLGLLAVDVFFQPPGAFIAAVLLIGGAALLLRARPAMFVTQLAFSALLAGLVLLVAGFRGVLYNPELLMLLAVLVGVALAIRVAWVQRVLGFLAAGVALALLLWPLGGGAEASFGWVVWDWRFSAFPMTLNAVLLALLWALWVARERHWAGRSWSPALLALADGAGAALLLAVVYGSTRHFWLLGMLADGPAGSADVATAGQARIFSLSGPALLQMALVLGAALWLLRHWRLRDPRDGLPPREQGLLALVYAVLLVGCLVVPHIGVVALVGTLALGSGRRLMLGLALAALLAQLSGFYYALDWPLAHKAALLAGLGAALGFALWALRALWPAGGDAAAAQAAARQRWLAPALIAAGAVLSLGLVHFDVQTKEQIIAQGQKIYVPLTPRDPRSLMQGDYMALNFAFPTELRQALNAGDPLGLTRHAQVVATLDARGVARAERVARAGEPLAAGERLLPVKRLKGDWVLVTDAFYFPEGQGGPFAQARFGEFRALADGRALLVGLADERLQAIAPAPVKP